MALRHFFRDIGGSSFISNYLQWAPKPYNRPARPGQHMCQPARPRAPAGQFKKVARKFATWNFQWWKFQTSWIRRREAANVDRFSQIFSTQITSSSLKISPSHVRATRGNYESQELWEHDSAANKVLKGSISVSLNSYTFDCNYWQFWLKLVLVLSHVNPSKSDAFGFGIKIARSC